ncbi:MAG: hypothetical protein ACRC1K_18435 [Planctomycetia bacterium]
MPSSTDATNSDSRFRFLQLEDRLALAADTEPNESFDSANVIGPLTNQALTIATSSDNDFFKFTTTAAGTVQIRLSFVHSAGDLDLQVLDGDTRQVIDTSEGVLDNESIDLPVAAGRNLVFRVFRFEFSTGAVANQPYSLNVTGPLMNPAAPPQTPTPPVTPVPPPVTAPNPASPPPSTLVDAIYREFEPNDRSDRANIVNSRTLDPIPPLQGNAFIQGTIQGSESDFFRFAARRTGPITVTLEGFRHADGDLDFELQDEDGTRLQLSGGIQDREVVTFNARTIGEQFVVKVFRFSNAGGVQNYTIRLSNDKVGTVDPSKIPSDFTLVDGSSVSRDRPSFPVDPRPVPGVRGGVTVSSLLRGRAFDRSVRNRLGIAVVGRVGNGYEYRLADGRWRRIGSVSETRALLLSSNTRIRNISGRGELSVVAWDQSIGRSGSRANVRALDSDAMSPFSLLRASRGVIRFEFSQAPMTSLPDQPDFRFESGARTIRTTRSVRDTDREEDDDTDNLAFAQLISAGVPRTLDFELNGAEIDAVLRDLALLNSRNVTLEQLAADGALALPSELASDDDLTFEDAMTSELIRDFLGLV